MWECKIEKILIWWGMYPPGVQLPPPPFMEQINKAKEAAAICTHTPSRVAPGYHPIQDSNFIDKGHPRRGMVRIKCSQ
jgi:hypothetical protein